MHIRTPKDENRIVIANILHYLHFILQLNWNESNSIVIDYNWIIAKLLHLGQVQFVYLVGMPDGDQFNLLNARYAMKMSKF